MAWARYNVQQIPTKLHQNHQTHEKKFLSTHHKPTIFACFTDGDGWHNDDGSIARHGRHHQIDGPGERIAGSTIWNIEI